MTAKGRVGQTRYEKKELDDPEWTDKTYYIAEDLINPKKMALKATQKKVNLMEKKAINRPASYVRREVLHKGLWKHKLADYHPPNNMNKIRAAAKEQERLGRNAEFEREMLKLLV